VIADKLSPAGWTWAIVALLRSTAGAGSLMLASKSAATSSHLTSYSARFWR